MWHKDVPTSDKSNGDFGRNEETAFSHSDSRNNQDGCFGMTTV